MNDSDFESWRRANMRHAWWCLMLLIACIVGAVLMEIFIAPHLGL